MINFKLEDFVEDSLSKSYDGLKKLKSNIFTDVALSFRAAMPHRFPVSKTAKRDLYQTAFVNNRIKIQ
jgi:hypothetical protein